MRSEPQQKVLLIRESVAGLPVFADEVDDADVLLAGPDDADGAVAVAGGQQGLPVGRRVHEVLHALVGKGRIAHGVINGG